MVMPARLKKKSSVRAEVFQSKTFAVATVLFAVLTDVTIYSIIIPIVPFIVRDLSLDDSYTGHLLTIYGAGMVLGSLLFGYLNMTAHFSLKALMLCAILALGGATALFAAANSVWMLMMARFLQGASSNGVWVLGLSLIAKLYEKDAGMGQAMSIVMCGYSMGQLVGPPLGGYLYRMNKIAPFLFCGALVAVDFMFRVLLIDPEQGVGGSGSSLGSSNGDLASSQDEIIAKKQKPKLIKLLSFKTLWVVLFLNAALSFVQNGIEPTLPLYFNQAFGFEAEQIGLSYLALIVPYVVGGLLGGYLYDKLGMRSTFLAGFIPTCIAVFIASIPSNFPAFVAQLCFLGLCLGMAVVPISPAIPHSVPTEFASLAYSLMTIVWALGIWVGPSVGTVVFLKFGWMWQMILFGGVLTLSSLAVLALPNIVLKGEDRSS
ncbi:hypothetical protein HDU78_005044 [Chytriomyces hyalinus]|nr:hypothetical protein HDU78_005044 [Chytriomyces hyalinus]